MHWKRQSGVFGCHRKVVKHWQSRLRTEFLYRQQGLLVAVSCVAHLAPAGTAAAPERPGRWGRTSKPKGHKVTDPISQEPEPAAPPLLRAGAAPAPRCQPGQDLLRGSRRRPPAACAQGQVAARRPRPPLAERRCAEPPSPPPRFPGLRRPARGRAPGRKTFPVAAAGRVRPPPRSPGPRGCPAAGAALPLGSEGLRAASLRCRRAVTAARRHRRGPPESVSVRTVIGS